MDKFDDKQFDPKKFDPGKFDRDHLWHPYTSLVDAPDMQLVSSAKGCVIELDDGTLLVDGMASWWSAIQGYNHPEINKALTDQLSQFAHVMFGGLTHRPAIELGNQLLDMVSPKLDAIFYSDSGSVAVEVAIKMALQYWQGKERPEKNNLITLRSGYHGDTFATMALSDPDNGMHSRFSSIVYEPHYIDKPPSGYSLDVPSAYYLHLEQVIAKSANTSAAVILEPVVQNAGGMNIYNPQILKRIRELCDQHGLLLILDEIATGFGRTGKLFGYMHADIEPDILVLGKAMTAGYLSFAATLATRDVADGMAGKNNDPLMHGPTYMGNALAASVALKNLQIIAKGAWEKQITGIESQLLAELDDCRSMKGVRDVRVLGAIAVVELDRLVDLAKATPALVNQGVWLRPFRNLIYCMPPYVISTEQLTKITRAIKCVIESGSY